MLRKFKNNANSTLAAPLGELDVTLTVPGTHGNRFPVVAAPDYFTVTLRDSSGNTEIVKVTARLTDQDAMTVARGQEGTSPLNWLIGAVVSMRLTAGAIEGLATQADAETLTNKTMGAGCAWSGTEVPVAKGGTGATTAAAARASLQAQTQDAALDSLSALAAAPNHVVITTGADTYGAIAYGVTGAALLDDATAADARATLGLGPLATEAITLTPFTQQLNVVADPAAGRTLLGAAADSSWQTVWIPAAAMIAQPSAGPSQFVYELPNAFVIRALAFAAAQDRAAQFSIRMPKGWNEGAVKAHFVWDSTYGNNGAVTWLLQGTALTNGDSMAAAAWIGGQGITHAIGNGDTIGQSPATPELTLNGSPSENDLAIFRVLRVGTWGSDSLNVDARLHGVVLLYQTASLNDA